ncbi:UvrD-helicase domain-containing protein [Granulicella sp. 5B5]|uniref:UvrD-helicase domain-containing protein n=1 Tax=Granulicella sp. 5B5 TaxID=1617967 RepID=UPI0015F77142|nr:UvrD-helicase domain-containing protein [Granulicella sp. 5B5]
MSNVVLFPGTQSPPLSDDAAREQALDIRASCIVEAPAGSGKTGLLVQRFLKLLADDSVDAPEEVLAVTFTRKATGELRERVLQQLAAAQAAIPLAADAPTFARNTREFALAVLERSQQRNWQLLEQPTRLNIQTFDAVGMQIANALPILAGGGGPRSPLEDARSLHRLAARHTLLELGGTDTALNDALRIVLLHRDGNLNDCETLIAEMLSKREQWGELVPLSRSLTNTELDTEVRPRLERSLQAIVNAGLQRAEAALPAGELAYLANFARQFATLPGYNDAPSPVAACVNKPHPPAPIVDDLDHWRTLIRLVLKESDGGWRKSLAINSLGFKPPKPALDDLKQHIAAMQSEPLRAALENVLTLPPPTYPDDQWRIAKALFLVLRRALAELKLLFASRGECDFTELALAARQVLRSDSTASDLALSAGGRLRHLLIDEMQDTSAGQYELVELLTRSWDGATQTLFLVGDPKQSIYLFRAASVERFLRTMATKHLGEIALTPLRLTANFRSQAALVEGPGAFNDAFSRLFLPPGAPMTEAMDVPFVAATASRPRTIEPAVVWHTELLAADDSTHAEHEAHSIRHLIEQRLSRPLPEGRAKPWRIAVLGHGRRHLQAVVAELKTDRGNGPLPFKAINLDSLEDRPEVLDTLALTRALLHPADRIAWLAVLRAPWCGLDRADLLTLTGDSVHDDSTVASLVAAHGDRLSTTGQRLLARAWTVLQAAIDTLGQTSLALHVERTWRSLGGDRILSAESQRNVLRYLALLHELEAEGGRVDLDVLTARLRELYAEPLAGDAQIELLTIHKAKGLEWDMVLVPGLERGSGNTRTPLLNWLEFDLPAPHDEAAVILAPIASKGTSADRLSTWLNQLRSQRELAERKRLFYVASTRAQEELHLFAAVGTTSSGNLASAHHTSLLKACWPAAEPHFAAQLNGLASVTPDTEVSSRPESAVFADVAERPASGLALAASVEQDTAATTQYLSRLPLTFDPAARFREAATHRLDYPAATTLPQARTFDRPEGSFGVRAFGNVVHRYLQLLADRLTHTASITLASELTNWLPRLEASLRSEGLPPRDATQQAARALEALTRTLADPTGLWLLSPHPQAASEGALTVAGATGLRVDRTFLAGPEPLSTSDNTIWIVDFKTTDQGSLTDAAFDALQRNRYSAQLEAYAHIRSQLPDGNRPIQLGLYFPLAARLIHWDSIFRHTR